MVSCSVVVASLGEKSGQFCSSIVGRLGSNRLRRGAPRHFDGGLTAVSLILGGSVGGSRVSGSGILGGVRVCDAGIIGNTRLIFLTLVRNFISGNCVLGKLRSWIVGTIGSCLAEGIVLFATLGRTLSSILGRLGKTRPMANVSKSFASALRSLVGLFGGHRFSFTKRRLAGSAW